MRSSFITPLNVLCAALALFVSIAPVRAAGAQPSAKNMLAQNTENTVDEAPDFDVDAEDADTEAPAADDKILDETSAAIENINEYQGPEIRYANGMLSLKAQEEPFGTLLENIGKAAGFEVKVEGEIAAKSLSTDFSDMHLKRGIERLLRLISHRNYFIFYGENDEITKVEVYNAGNSSADKVMPAPTPGAGRPQPRAARPSRPAPPAVTRPTPARSSRPQVQTFTSEDSATGTKSTSPARTAPVPTPRPPALTRPDDNPYDTTREPSYIPPSRRVYEPREAD